MKRILLFCALLVILLLFVSFVKVGGKGFSDLKKVLEKYGLDGVLAPGSMQELNAFENDLLSLKAQAQIQKSRETEALVSMIDFRLAIVQMERDFLKAAEEARFVDYYNPSCSKPTSLKKTIDYLDQTLTQADLAIALANNFSNNFKEFTQASGLDFARANRILSEFKTIVLEKKERYKAFCT